MSRSLAETHRALCKQWHPTKNGSPSPGSVTAGSSKKVWWICDKGHEWEAVIYQRATMETGCPYCTRRKASPETSLEATHPQIAAEWHPTKNGELRPEDVTKGSSKTVWWLCPEGHEFQQVVKHRVGRSGLCPICYRRGK